MVEISTLCAPCFNSSPTHRWTLNTQYSEDWKKQGIFIVQFSLISQSEINPYSCVANIKTRLQTRMPTPPKPAGVNLSENSAHTFSQRWLNGLLSTYRDLNPITTGKICKPETLHVKGVFRRQKITISPHLQLPTATARWIQFENIFKMFSNRTGANVKDLIKIFLLVALPGLPTVSLSTHSVVNAWTVPPYKPRLPAAAAVWLQ